MIIFLSNFHLFLNFKNFYFKTLMRRNLQNLKKRIEFELSKLDYNNLNS